jgi:hypothetical protein
MRNEAATETIKGQLHRVLDDLRTDIERVELLTAALDAFSSPVPEYEPKFHHVQRSSRQVKELGRRSSC